MKTILPLLLETYMIIQARGENKRIKNIALCKSTGLVLNNTGWRHKVYLYIFSRGHATLHLAVSVGR